MTVPDCRLCGRIVTARDARAAPPTYRLAMDFPDSAFAALNIGSDEPLRFGRLLALALALTLIAVGAGLLVGGVQIS